MKLAFSSLGCSEVPLHKLADLAAGHGFSGVELRGVEGEHIHTGLSRSERKKLRQIFRDAQVEAICITAYTGFASDDPLYLSQQIETLREYARLASDIGSTRIRTFMGGGKIDGEARAFYTTGAEALLKAAEECAEYGVTVVMETHDTLSSTKETMAFLNKAEHENLRILWDIPHSLRTGETLDEGWNRIGDRVEYVHLKDEYLSPEGELRHCLPGEGTVPLTRCRDLLKSNGFEGWYCLEWERKWHPEMPPLDKALKAFKRIME